MAACIGVNMSEEKKIMLNGNEYKLSDLTAGQISLVQQINRCSAKIHELELDLGQVKMAYDGFISTLEKSLVHTVPELNTDLKKSAWLNLIVNPIKPLLIDTVISKTISMTPLVIQVAFAAAASLS